MRSALVFLASCVAVVGQTCPVGTNYALQFDSGDWIRIPDSPVLDGFQDFTFEFWIKTSATGTRHILTKGATDGGSQLDDSYGIVLNFPGCAPGTLWVELYEPGSSASICSNSPINTGMWRHVAVTRSASTVTIFIDGVADASSSYAPVLGTSHNPLAIASLLFVNGTPSGRQFQGSLDEIRIWNIHRNQQEILATMHASLSGAEAGLVGYWRLDDAPGQVVSDASAYGNDGTLGATLVAGGDDPVWSGSDVAPLPYCSAVGTGQANGPMSGLTVNGIGVGAGPFVVAAQPGSFLSFDWVGPPHQPFTLIAGPFNPGGAVFAGFGGVDIGTPPTFADTTVLFNGAQPSSLSFFTTDAAGQAHQAARVPMVPAGTLISVQGFMFQPPGASAFGSFPTAAFRIDVL